MNQHVSTCTTYPQNIIITRAWKATILKSGSFFFCHQSASTDWLRNNKCDFFLLWLASLHCICSSLTRRGGWAAAVDYFSYIIEFTGSCPTMTVVFFSFCDNCLPLLHSSLVERGRWAAAVDYCSYIIEFTGSCPTMTVVCFPFVTIASLYCIAPLRDEEDELLQ